MVLIAPSPMPRRGTVHDALKRKVVGRLRQDARIGDGIADFGSLIESQAAHHAIGNAQRDHAFFERARLVAGAY